MKTAALVLVGTYVAVTIGPPLAAAALDVAREVWWQVWGSRK